MNDNADLFNIKQPQPDPQQGGLLISEPFLDEIYFQRACVLLVDYLPDFPTTGLVLNKRINLNLNDVIPELKIDKKLIPLTRKEQEENIQVDCSEIYNRFDIHLHVPEGATPKDGPSAGIAIGSAIASLFSNRPIKSSFAMTGELTLRGKVLPIGGLQEKLIAAFKSGIKEVLIPKKNFERDMDEIPDEVKENVKIHPVEDFREVLKYILETK